MKGLGCESLVREWWRRVAFTVCENGAKHRGQAVFKLKNSLIRTNCYEANKNAFNMEISRRFIIS